jgi:hypothetical protein
MELQSENFEENIILVWQQKGKLWTRISRVLFGFSTYIYSFERSAFVSFSMMYVEILSDL